MVSIPDAKTRTRRHFFIHGKFRMVNLDYRGIKTATNWMEVSFLIETGNWGGGPVHGLVGNGYPRQLVVRGQMD